MDRNILAEARWPHHCNRGAWGHSCSVWGAALLSLVLRFRLLLWVWQRAEQAELRTEQGPEVKGQHGPSRHLAASWSWETLLGSLDTWERERSGGKRKEHVHQLFLWGSRRRVGAGRRGDRRGWGPHPEHVHGASPARNGEKCYVPFTCQSSGCPASPPQVLSKCRGRSRPPPSPGSQRKTALIDQFLRCCLGLLQC